FGFGVVVVLALLALAFCAACGDATPVAAAATTQPTTQPTTPPAVPAEPEGMVWIPAGRYAMGSAHGDANEQPVHEVSVHGFWLDVHEVTNAQFARFADATHYVTLAERTPENPESLPEALRVPGSLVFTRPQARVSLDDPGGWWQYRPGACWRHPEG